MSTAVSSLDTTLDAPAEDTLAAGRGAALPVGASLAAGAAVAGASARTAAGEAVAAVRRSRWWVEALTIAWLCWLYDAVTNLAPLRLGAALTHGRDILSAERTLGIAPEHALDSWLAGRHALGVVVSYYYDNAHFLVTLGLLGFLWWRRADIYRPLRSSLVLINVLGFVVFWRYPVAPPRMLGGFTDVVATSHALGSWHTGALASDANQLAAMPSLHLAWAVWCTIAVWRMTRRVAWRALAAVYPLLTAFAVLATGNHYVLDIFGGAILAVASVLLVDAAPQGWRRLRGRARLAPSVAD
ncbi:MAG TPA: phosphatase PAP2 family protein [Solirubrobacteraceae bacterium]|nr:phosphatase PAP2 family protein [Solirubrobacteraceae bacterium]